MLANARKSLGIIVYAICILTCASSSQAIDGMVVASGDYSFPDKWYNTQFEAAPRLSSVQSVVKHQYFIVYILVGNYALDESNNANVKLDIEVLAPNDSAIFQAHDVDALTGKIENPSSMQLSPVMLKICGDEEHAFGRYGIEVTLRDKNADSQKDLQTHYDLVKFARVDWGDKGQKERSELMMTYYRTPQPLEALESFISVAQEGYSESAFWPVMSFYMEVFENNDFLMKYLLDNYLEQPDAVRAHILLLIYYMNYDAGDFMESLSDGDKARFDSLKDYNNLFALSEIVSPSQLDINWSRFFASGSYLPVRNIVGALEYKGFFDEEMLKKGSDSSMEIDIDNNKGLCYYAAKWSLGANCANYPLVRDYCRYMLVNEELPSGVVEDLREILGE